VSLGNPRLGFVCTAQTTDGQHGLSGYFLEHDRDLAPEERLQFRPGELPPPFDPAAAPRLPAADWPPERLAKAERNYAMEYIRSGLPRLAEIFGPAEAAHLGRVSGRLVGAQLYRETAALLGIDAKGAQAFGAFMVGLAAGEGDSASVANEGAAVLVRRPAWRLMRGLEPLSPAVFEAWNGLLEGALVVHDRFLLLEVTSRLDWGERRVRVAHPADGRRKCRLGSKRSADPTPTGRRLVLGHRGRSTQPTLGALRAYVPANLRPPRAGR
jgi:hypothetical protein